MHATFVPTAPDPRHVHVADVDICPMHVDSHCDVSSHPLDAMAGHWKSATDPVPIFCVHATFDMTPPDEATLHEAADCNCPTHVDWQSLAFWQLTESWAGHALTVVIAVTAMHATALAAPPDE